MAIIKIPVYLVIDDTDDAMSDISDEIHVIDVNNIINSNVIYIELMSENKGEF